MRDGFEGSLGEILYRQPSATKSGRSFLLVALLSLPWVLVPVIWPGRTPLLISIAGVIAGLAMGVALVVLLRRRAFDAIHEHGATVLIGEERKVLWFSNETLVTEIHEIVKEQGEPDDDQWVFTVRDREGVLSLTTGVPNAAGRIRDALTRAVGRPPAQINRR